jgi:sugar phosphate isomerase/epimerase
MIFSLSTRWNAGRHSSGEAMLEEILALGFTHVELGYDLSGHLVPGVEKMVAAGAVTVTSLHNYCPVPAGAPIPHPEIFTLTNPARLSRENAVFHTANTIRFAAENHARVVVVHCGNVDMSGLTFKLIALADAGEQSEPVFDKTKMKMLVAREKAVKQQIGFLYEGIEKLLPVLQETGVALAIEILPMWESIPTEIEIETLLRHFNSPHLRYWHDMGHAQIRENLGLTSHLRWLSRLRPWLAGMHVHDVIPTAKDHQMPGHGMMPFPQFREVARDPILRVLEPSPTTPPEDVVEGLRILRQAWDDAAAPAAPGG